MATPPIDDMPKITLEKDDLESFQRSRAQTGKPSAKQKSQHETPQSTSRSPSWLMFILLLALLSGGAVYWSMQQHKLFLESQNRIADLEQHLSATGEEMDQSTVALGVKVTELSKRTEELWEQMDKLWASAWRRNQSDIADITTAVNSLKSSNDSSVKSLNGKLGEQDTALTLITSQLSDYAGNLKQQQDALGQIKQNTQNNEQQLASLREKIISTALGNNNLVNKIDDLESKIAGLERSIAQAKSPSPAPSTP